MGKEGGGGGGKGCEEKRGRPAWSCAMLASGEPSSGFLGGWIGGYGLVHVGCTVEGDKLEGFAFL